MYLLAQVVEPSGAVAATAVLTNKLPIEDNDGDRIQSIGIIISGGNVDLDQLPWL